MTRIYQYIQMPWTRPLGFDSRPTTGAIRHAHPWLFSAVSDLSILVIPAVFTALVFSIAWNSGDASGVGIRAYAGWITAFILGNTTHVILTFLLLNQHPDMLHSTPGQARKIIIGCAAVFIVSFVFFWLTKRSFSFLATFGISVVLCFATHHALSQAKGFWSLYSMRAAAAGLGSMPKFERSLQQLFVPLALALILVRWFFVRDPFIAVVPDNPHLLPGWFVHGLTAVWSIYSCALMATLIKHRSSLPKRLYLFVHLSGVMLAIASPGWGAILLGSIHGLEYYVISARMLRSPETGRGVTSSVRPMALTMLPLFLVGVLNAPFVVSAVSAPHLYHFETARILVNCIVMAHYFADACIYRFSVPGIRNAAISKLGF